MDQQHKEEYTRGNWGECDHDPESLEQSNQEQIDEGIERASEKSTGSLNHGSGATTHQGGFHSSSALGTLREGNLPDQDDTISTFPPGVVTQNAVSPLKCSPDRKGIPHVYRDFSNVPDSVAVVRKKTGGVATPFPEKLHDMLNIETEEHPSAVTWLPHGRAFLVRDPHEFTDYIMPKYFKQTKLTSFQRQLNLYGFRRLTQGCDAGAYYHELFLRGKPQLCMRMQRQKVKGTGHKQPADVQTEPNFYNMSPSERLPYLSPPASDPPTENQPRLPYTSLTTATVARSSGNIAPKNNDGAGGGNSVPSANLSPGMGGVHSAAQLLKGLAAGVSFSLGQSAAQANLPSVAASARFSGSSLTATAARAESSGTTRRTTTTSTLDPFVSKEPLTSISLLGRVINIGRQSQPEDTQVTTQSAFFWPPRAAASTNFSSASFTDIASTMPASSDGQERGAKAGQASENGDQSSNDRYSFGPSEISVNKNSKSDNQASDRIRQPP